MKLLPILFALTLLFAILLVAADPDGYAQYTSTDLKTRVDAAKPDDHKVRLDRVANWGNHSLLAIRREGDGEAEVHDTQVDVIFVKSGEGTLILGGTVVEPRTTAPGEIRGKSIKGGVSKKMAAGDVIHIPAKIPHQMLVPKALSFEVVKVDTK
jgi:mannose-6-phosphate isomerase-like protein (cupin superfamily)